LRSDPAIGGLLYGAVELKVGAREARGVTGACPRC